MQYKIPVHIENEDSIIFGLSFKQLAFIMVGGGIAYGLYKDLAEALGQDIGLLVGLSVWGVFIFIATFKQYEMRFMLFILSVIRLNINPKERMWLMGVDSYNEFEIGYLKQDYAKSEEKVDFETKIDKINNIDEKLKNI